MRASHVYPITQPDVEAVARFTDSLGALRPEDWLAAAEAADRDLSSRSVAHALVEALIAHHGLGVQAWDALDDVQTVTHGILDGTGTVPPTRRAAARLRAARSAAGAAALALLVRPLLAAHDFELLYRPFLTLVPV